MHTVLFASAPTYSFNDGGNPQPDCTTFSYTEVDSAGSIDRVIVPGRDLIFAGDPLGSWWTWPLPIGSTDEPNALEPQDRTC